MTNTKDTKTASVEAVETVETAPMAEEAETRIYELGYHIIPTVKEDEVEQVVADIRNYINEFNANFIAEGAPQSMKLAYEMAVMSDRGKRTLYDRAYFGWIKFEVVPEGVVELKKKMAADLRILRSIIFLTVREDTRAAARANSLREIKRTDTIDMSRKTTDEKSDKPVSQEAIDKAIDNIVVE